MSAENEELLARFYISLPLTAYTDASVNSVCVLHNRLIVPLGSYYS